MSYLDQAFKYVANLQFNVRWKKKYFIDDWSGGKRLLSKADEAKERKWRMEQIGKEAAIFFGGEEPEEVTMGYYLKKHYPRFFDEMVRETEADYIEEEKKKYPDLSEDEIANLRNAFKHCLRKDLAEGEKTYLEREAAIAATRPAKIGGTGSRGTAKGMGKIAAADAMTQRYKSASGKIWRDLTPAEKKAAEESYKNRWNKIAADLRNELMDKYGLGKLPTKEELEYSTVDYLRTLQDDLGKAMKTVSFSEREFYAKNPSFLDPIPSTPTADEEEAYIRASARYRNDTIIGMYAELRREINELNKQAGLHLKDKTDPKKKAEREALEEQRRKDAQAQYDLNQKQNLERELNEFQKDSEANIKENSIESTFRAINDEEHRLKGKYKDYPELVELIKSRTLVIETKVRELEDEKKKKEEQKEKAEEDEGEFSDDRPTLPNTPTTPTSEHTPDTSGAASDTSTGGGGGSSG